MKVIKSPGVFNAVRPDYKIIRVFYLRPVKFVFYYIYKAKVTVLVGLWITKSREPINKIIKRVVTITRRSLVKQKAF